MTGAASPDETSPAPPVRAISSAVILSGAYLAAQFGLITLPGLGPVPAWGVSAFLKASGIITLALTALMTMRGVDRLLALALGLSAIGDIALAWSPSQLLFGMGAFGAAHLVYVALFQRRLARDGVNRTGLAAAAGVIAIGAALMAWLWPAMGAMAIPSFGYMAVLFAMAVLALSTRGFALAALGAVSFVVSDAMIAIGLYSPEVPIPPGAVWITYVAAQVLIFIGMQRTAR
ncbi:MAG: lysoplasmalogenase [Pseudomonadota bacterium]